MQAHFNAWKASRASSESDTHSDFLLAPSLAKVFIQWLGNPCEAFYELPVMAYEAKEGLNLHVGLQQWCTFSNSL